jgi:IBR domain/IBR domain, a half RING-finger domain
MSEDTRSESDSQTGRIGNDDSGTTMSHTEVTEQHIEAANDTEVESDHKGSVMIDIRPGGDTEAGPDSEIDGPGPSRVAVSDSQSDTPQQPTLSNHDDNAHVIATEAVDSATHDVEHIEEGAGTNSDDDSDNDDSDHKAADVVIDITKLLMTPNTATAPASAPASAPVATELPHTEVIPPDLEFADMDLAPPATQRQLSWSELQGRIQALVAMGFTFDQAERALAYVETVEEALEFLLSDQDHDYSPDTNWGVDSCTVCGRPRSEHATGPPAPSAAESDLKIQEMDGFMQTEHDFEIARALSDRFLSERVAPVAVAQEEVKERALRYPVHEFKDGEGVMCMICCEEVGSEDMIELPCKHSFCLNCVDYYCEERITKRRIAEDDFECMANCGTIIPMEMRKQLVSKEVWDKYQRFADEAKVDADPNAMFCPDGKCGNVLHRDRKSQTQVHCDECDLDYCFLCHQPYHGRTACDDAAHNALVNWAQDFGTVLKRCPRCRYHTEKASGCNHMTCTRCHYEWCWLCQGKYSDMHFAPWNLFGCPGMQSGSIQYGCFMRMVIRLLVLLAFLVGLPCLLGLGAILCALSPLYCILKVVAPDACEGCTECFEGCAGGVVSAHCVCLCLSSGIVMVSTVCLNDRLTNPIVYCCVPPMTTLCVYVSCCTV